MTLREVIEQHRVVVCVGSGGVGKTTTAAALALHASLEGKRVLCLTIDPARRLANSMGLDAMTQEVQDVEPHLFERAGLHPTGVLSAMMLDTKRTFDDLVERHASTPQRRDRILKNRLYQYISTSLAGTQEYMAMEKLHAVRRATDYDLIVLDTPPTSNALDFLDAPERLVEAIDSPAMRWFAEAFTDAGKLGFGMLGRGASLVLKGLAKFTGAEFLDSVAEFVMDINDLFGGFTERAHEVSDALRGPEVAFVLVTSPDPMAVQETLFFASKLRNSGMQPKATVINRVNDLLPEPSEPADVTTQALTLLQPPTPAEGLSERLFEALDQERTRAVADRVEVERLRTETAGKELQVEVPAFDHDVHDLRSLAKVASYLIEA